MKEKACAVAVGRAEPLGVLAVGDKCMRVQSFPPLSRPDARILILGTMPGVRSLEQRAYYAHPRNAFWPIMLSTFADATLDFTARQSWTYDACVTLLASNQISVWDVLADCVRPGSLDTAIDAATAQANDLPGFIGSHRQLERIVFNGQGATRLFKRHVARAVSASLDDQRRSLERLTLPSTSPAMASLTLAQKHERWEPALVLR